MSPAPEAGDFVKLIVLYPLQVLRGILQQKNKDTLSQYLILN
jgi:hypothetical protein